MHEASHQLRCVGCGAVILPDAVEKDFRCVDCGELLEVEYPSWSAAGAPALDPGPRRMPNPGALRWLWQERLQSRLPIDQSGVWRFRELLPILLHPEKAVTLREGNTPLYRLLQSGRGTGAGAALRQTSGHEPNRLVQRHGYDGCTFAGPRAGLPMGGLCFDRQYLGLDGGLRLPRPHEQPGFAARGQDFLVQAVPGTRLRRGHLPAEHRLRWLRTGADGSGAACAGLFAQLRQSLPAGRSKDRRPRDSRGVRLAGPGSRDRARRQSGQQFRSGQRLSGNDALGAQPARSRKSAWCKPKAPIRST